jgi:hypothetical protein
MEATLENKEASFTQNPYPYPTLFRMCYGFTPVDMVVYQLVMANIF